MNIELFGSKRIQHWMPAVRDSFVVSLPLTMMIAVITVVLNIPFDAYADAMISLFGSNWKFFGLRLYEATAGIMALVISVIVALRLDSGLSTNTRKQIIAIMVVAAYSGSVGPILNNFTTMFGSSNLPLGIFVGIATIEFFKIYDHLLGRRRIFNQLQESLLLQESARMILPAFLTVVTVVVLGTIVIDICAEGMKVIGIWASEIVTHASNTHWLSCFVILINQLFWLIGLHGSNMVETLFPTLIASAQVLEGGGKVSIAVINTFVYMGGSGATAGIVLALIMQKRQSGMRRVAMVSLFPAIINVNEIILYGLPIVFSRILLVPFIVAPLVCYSIVLVAQGMGFLELSGKAVPWSTPPLVSGYLVSASWSGVVVQLFGILASTAIYWPFLKALEQRRMQRQGEELRRTLDLITNSQPASEGFTRRGDSIGDMCRSLIADFESDLDAGKVKIVYQGKHDANGRLCGAEALLRWNHGTHGPISAFSIVRLAEESGLIVKLGDYVISHTCEAMARWQKAGLQHIKVSVNVSPLQLESPHLFTYLMDTLIRCGLDVSSLDLEITEGQALSHSEASDATLRLLVENGFSLSLDDFGMGYTSLLYLRRFQVSRIKLDGILTRNVVTNNLDADIVKSICELGHQQQTGVVAEFVETEPQKNRLMELGCTEFQGYLFSKPLSEADFMALIATNRSESAGFR